MEDKDLTQVALLVEGLIITPNFCILTIHTPRDGTDGLHSISPVVEVTSTSQVVTGEP